MSDLAQAALIGGGIFLVVMAGQFGRRDLSWQKIVYPLVSIAVFGYSYLKDAPTATAGEWELYGVALALGLCFAAVATLFTGMERDTTTGRVMTICGTGFVVTWAVALVARLIFIWSVNNVDAVHDQVGTFMLSHQIETRAIAPFFVIWALTMVVGRIVAIQVRAHKLAAMPGTGDGRLTSRRFHRARPDAAQHSSGRLAGEQLSQQGEQS